MRSGNSFPFPLRLNSVTGPTLCLAAWLAAGLIGCMAEPDGPGRPQIDDPLPSDDDLSGTTSSTNWPEESPACDEDYRVIQTSDSLLSLMFRQTLEPSNLVEPVQISGSITFFKGGVIPGFAAVPSYTWQFEDKDSLVLPVETLLGQEGFGGSDTLSFSIQVDSERDDQHIQCILVGYVYSLTEKRFLQTPITVFSNTSYFLRKPAHSLRGPFKTLIESLPVVKGNSKFSFYIPGTNFFWKKELADSVELGYLPKHDGYPVRLLRTTEGEGPNGETLLEIFEVQFAVEKKQSLERGVYYEQVSRVVRSGWSGRKPSTFSLRDTLPRSFVGGRNCGE